MTKDQEAAIVEAVIWAVCPITRAADECDMPQIMHGPRPECRRCPVEEARGGTAGCRIVAELAARAAIAAHIRALEEAGWRCVPVKPTETMVDAGGDTLLGNYPMAETVWRRMLAAAPRAGTEERGE